MSYRWRSGANWGGGFAQVGDALGDDVVTIGDMWGAARSRDGGRTWRATNLGAPSVPTGRAVVLSRRPATRGWAYVGIGPSHGTSPGQGYFGVLSPDGRIRVVDASPFGFALSIDNANAITPRPAGSTIVVDYDPTSDRESVYACSPNAISRYTNDDVHPLASSSLAPVRIKSVPQCWRAAVLLDRDRLLLGTFTKTANGVAQTPKVYVLSGIRGASSGSSLSQIKTGLAVNAFRWIGGRLYAVCSTGLYRIETPSSPTTSAWTRLGAGFFDDLLLDIAGDGAVLFVGQANAALNLKAGHAVAKSTDAGRTWRWTATVEHSELFGSTDRWWLSGSAGGISDNSYDTSQMASSGTTILSFGRRGVWASPDSGDDWYPAMRGLGGTSNMHVVVNNGTINTSDEDWGAAISTDRFVSARRGAPVPYPSSMLTRTVGGHVYRVLEGSPCDVTRDGVSIADDVFRGWAVKGNLEDLAIGPEGTVYVVASGGALLAGDPA